MREILPYLLVGNATNARDLRQIHLHRIAAVVDLAGNEPPALLSRDLIYCRFPLVDGGGNQEVLTATAIRCVVHLVQGNIRTLVACSAGVSRAPSITAAALAYLTHKSLDECLLEVVREGPNDVSPLFWNHVCQVYRDYLSPAH